MVCKRLFAKRLHLSRQKTSLQMHHWVTHYKCSVSNFYKSLTKRDILESEWFFRTMYIIVTFYFSVEMLNSWWHCNLSFFIWQADWSIEFQFSKLNKHHAGLTIFIYLILFFFNIPSMYYIYMILNDLLNLYEIAVGRTKRAEIVKSPTFLKKRSFSKELRIRSPAHSQIHKTPTKFFLLSSYRFCGFESRCSISFTTY